MKTSGSKGYGQGARLVPALVVIAAGMVFLLDNLGVDLAVVHLQNWWAWLILVAAISPLSRAWQHYRRTGAVDAMVANSLFAAGAIAMVAMIFILEMSWAQWWPVFVIYGGLSMLTRGSRCTA